MAEVNEVTIYLIDYDNEQNSKLVAERSFLEHNLFINIRYASNKKPFLDNGYLSIAHTQGLLVLAVSEVEVGIDVEYVSHKNRASLINRLFSEEESKSIVTSTDFYKAWTAKESIAKLLGTGLTKELMKQSVQKACSLHNMLVKHIQIDNYVIAFCTYCSCDVKIKDWRM